AARSESGYRTNRLVGSSSGCRRVPPAPPQGPAGPVEGARETRRHGLLTPKLFPSLGGVPSLLRDRHEVPQDVRPVNLRDDLGRFVGRVDRVNAFEVGYVRK